MSQVAVQVGDRVLVPKATKNDVERRGIVRFLGETRFGGSGTVWSGLLLDEANGKNDGSVAGIKYFDCPPLRGLFVPANKLRRIAVQRKILTAPSSQFTRRQAPAVKRTDVKKSSRLPVQKRPASAKADGDLVGKMPPTNVTASSGRSRLEACLGRQGLLGDNAGAIRSARVADQLKRELKRSQTGFLAMAVLVSHLRQKTLELHTAMFERCRLHERKIAEKEAEVAAFSSEMKSLASDFEVEIVSLEASQNDLKEHNKKLVDTIGILQCQVAGLESEKETLQSSIEERVENDVKAKVKKLPQEIDSLKAVVQIKDEQIRQLRQQNASLEDKAVATLKSQRKVRTMEEKCEQWEAQVEQQKDTLRRTNSETERLGLALQTERNFNGRLNQSVEELQWKLSMFEESANAGETPSRQSQSKNKERIDASSFCSVEHLQNGSDVNDKDC